MTDKHAMITDGGECFFTPEETIPQVAESNGFDIRPSKLTLN